MNRTDRLLAIILQIQASGTVRASDLAVRFHVARRTIYRDMIAIHESGVPIAAVPGSGYSIVEGYFLPPVNFTTEEASALVLGANAIAQNLDASFREAAHSAAMKIEAVLPTPRRQDLRLLKKRMSFLTMTPLEQPALMERLTQVRGAVLSCRSIQFVYHKRYPDATEPRSLRRSVNPYALTHISGRWLVSGYDFRRKAVRAFRLDRMEDLHVTERTFLPPKKFRIADLSRSRTPLLSGSATFANEIARWVLESKPFFVKGQRWTRNGLRLTLRTDSPQQVVTWLLGWGSGVIAIEPEWLRSLIANQVEDMHRRYHQTRK